MGTEFNAKIDAMEGLNAEEKKAFKEQNQQVVTEHFIPAYKALLEGLEALKGTGTNAEGSVSSRTESFIISIWWIPPSGQLIKLWTIFRKRLKTRSMIL